MSIFTFAIGIPTVNRFDLLQPSLESYLQDFPNIRIYIVDNGKQGIAEKYKDHELVTVFEPEQNKKHGLGQCRSYSVK